MGDINQWQFPKNVPGKVVGWSGTGKELINRDGAEVYKTRADVEAVTIAPENYNIVVEAYSSTSPSVGRANYRAASDADYAATPALLRLTDVTGRKFVINENRLSPDMAGGDPTGVADSSAAFNAIFDYIRTDRAANPDSSSRYVVDLAGGKYRVTSSINATNIESWNFRIENGIIVGACTGKAVLDLVNSRGYVLSSLRIYGEEDNMPSIGILAARGSTGSGACDNNSYEDVSVIGWFSVAADYCYAQETTQRRHCRFWNYSKTGLAGVYQGYNTYAATSDYQAIVTTAQSFINNRYENCDWRSGVLGGTNGYFKTITSITKGATTTILLSSAHDYEVGDPIIVRRLASSMGMNEIANMGGTVLSVNGNEIEIDIDSTSFTNYTANGGVNYRKPVPAVYFDRGNDHTFASCYLVTNSDHAIEVGFPDSHQPEQLTFDFLFEGGVANSQIHFKIGGTTRVMRSFKVNSYQTNAAQSFLSTNSSAGASVNIHHSQINVTGNTIKTGLPLTGNPAHFKLRNTRIWYPTIASVGTLSSFGEFAGEVYGQDQTTEYYAKGIVRYDDASGVVSASAVSDHYRPTAAATNDAIWDQQFYGKDSAGNKTLYASIRSVINSATDTAERGGLNFLLRVDGAAPSTRFRMNGRYNESADPFMLPTYTVATLPTASSYPRCLIYVSDGTSNKRLAISDGTNWRFPDGAVVS